MIKIPTRLKFFSIDPQKKGRGKGVYYHRGKGIWSMYSIDRDMKKLSKGWKINKVGLPKGTKIPHTSDGRLPI